MLGGAGFLPSTVSHIPYITYNFTSCIFRSAVWTHHFWLLWKSLKDLKNLQFASGNFSQFFQTSSEWIFGDFFSFIIKKYIYTPQESIVERWNFLLTWPPFSGALAVRMFVSGRKNPCPNTFLDPSTYLWIHQPIFHTTNPTTTWVLNAQDKARDHSNNAIHQTGFLTNPQNQRRCVIFFGLHTKKNTIHWQISALTRILLKYTSRAGLRY